jgi:hypothetical protein
MMAEHELAELAESIATNGLFQPIMLKGDVLIDGRNRLKACEIAGVEPRFEEINGEDVVEYILATNVERRHLNAGQRAIAYAFAYPNPTHRGGRGKTSTEPVEVSKTRLRDARRILRHSYDTAEAVFAGAIPFDKALADVIASEQAAQSDQAKLERLRTEAPDLADLVPEPMSLTEAYAALVQRKAEADAAEANKRETLLRLSESAYRGCLAWSNPDFAREVLDRLGDEQFRSAIIDRLRIDPAGTDILDGARNIGRLLAQLKGEGES